MRDSNPYNWVAATNSIYGAHAYGCVCEISEDRRFSHHYMAGSWCPLLQRAGENNLSRTQFDASEMCSLFAAVLSCPSIRTHSAVATAVLVLDRKFNTCVRQRQRWLVQTLKKVSTYRNMAAPATYLKNRPLTGVSTPLESVPFPVSCRGDGFFGSDSQPLKMEPVRTTEVSRDPYERVMYRRVL